MTVHSRRGAPAPRLFAFAALVLALPAGLAAQVTGSVGLGATGMQQPGAQLENSESLTPALAIGADHLALNLSGALTALPLGQWAAQGRGDVWLVSDPLVGRLRLGGEVGGSRLVRAGAFGSSVTGVADLLWDGGTWGAAAGAGVSAGFIPGLPDVTAFHGRLRAWRRLGAAQLSASVEPVAWYGLWYYDLAGGLDVAHGPLAASVALTARTGSAATGSVGGGASAQWFVLPSVAIEAAAGSTLRDPFQGLPEVRYASLGMRLFRSWRRAGSGTAAAAARSAPATQPQPLLADRAANGAGTMVRFRMPGARTLAIAGDWDGWRLHVLRPVSGAPGIFAGAVSVPPGRWHFTLLVDGRDWVVPEGIAAVPDTGDGGGVVSVLVVR